MNTEKRSHEVEAADIQQGNRAWWSRNTMSYDWNDKVSLDRFSGAWFDEIDARFVHAARLFASDKQPFDRIIPFEALAGKRVLEIGCGMGLHSELMCKAGAQVSAVDLSPTSVEATRRRFALKNLNIDLRQLDAEALPFADQTFDFIWSWGVIHHSARTARIVREIARMLKKSGESRVMVYNRSGICVPIVYLRDHVLKGGLLRQDFDHTLLASSDGYHARFYTPDQFADLFRAFFVDVTTRIFGQDADAIPLPSLMRRIGISLAPEQWLRNRQAKVGSFLFLEAREPA